MRQRAGCGSGAGHPGSATRVPCTQRVSLGQGAGGMDRRLAGPPTPGHRVERDHVLLVGDARVAGPGHRAAALDRARRPGARGRGRLAGRGRDIQRTGRPVTARRHPQRGHHGCRGERGGREGRCLDKSDHLGCGLLRAAHPPPPGRWRRRGRDSGRSPRAGERQQLSPGNSAPAPALELPAGSSRAGKVDAEPVETRQEARGPRAADCRSPGPGLARDSGLTSAAEHVSDDPADRAGAGRLRGAAVVREVR